MKTALSPLAFALTLTLTALSSAPAARAAEGNPLDALIDFDLVKADAQDVFKNVAKMLGGELSIEPQLKGKPITIHLDRVRLRTALNVACESLGCAWSLAEGKTPKLIVKATAAPAPKEPEKEAKAGLDEAIDIKVTQASVRDVLRSVAQLLSAELSLDPKVDGTIDLDLNKVPVRESLNRICREAGCRWNLATGEKAALVVTSLK